MIANGLLPELNERLGKTYSSVVATDIRRQVVAGLIYHIRLIAMPDKEVIHVRVYQPLNNEAPQLQTAKVCDTREPLNILQPTVN
jgi:hypothetical protein